jgi:hypothetical protein
MMDVATVVVSTSQFSLICQSDILGTGAKKKEIGLLLLGSKTSYFEPFHLHHHIYSRSRTCCYTPMVRVVVVMGVW